MIWETWPWRQELIAAAGRLEALTVSYPLDGDDDDLMQQDFELERDLLISGYAMRKLLESNKLPTSLGHTSVSVEVAPLLTDRVPTAWDTYELHEFYDLENTQRTSLGIGRLCNQLIHSTILVTEAAEPDGDRLTGIYVASDDQLPNGLLIIPIRVLVDLFRRVGEAETVAFVMERNADGGMNVTNWGEGEHPPRQDPRSDR